MAEILVIDDDPTIRSLTRLYLEKSGHSVYEAQDGSQGLDLFKKISPDAVITDIVMPEEEGFKTILEIRKLSKSVPIIVITGVKYMGDVDSLYVAEQFGADKGYHKPLNYQQLITDIEDLL
jgi:DNA-binding response OmpR family regulator